MVCLRKWKVCDRKLIWNLAHVLRTLRPETDPSGNLRFDRTQDYEYDSLFQNTWSLISHANLLPRALFHSVTDLASMFTVQRMSGRPVRAK